VTIDPSFDAYRKAAQMVGATAVGVPLRPVQGRAAASSKDLRLDVAELEAKLASSKQAGRVHTSRAEQSRAEQMRCWTSPSHSLGKAWGQGPG
jgi:hypothetical protein